MLTMTTKNWTMRLHQGLLAGVLPIAVVLATPLTAEAFSFSNMYVFGDSLVDAGRLYTLTGGTYPLSPPYFNGRFSNGPVWVETLASQLGLPANPFTNFALGGSSSGLTNAVVPNPLLPGVLAQVGLFTQNGTQAIDPNGLYIVSGGSNDFLFAGQTDPTVPVNNLTTALSLLATAGAKTILVANLPNLGVLPAALGTPAAPVLSAWSQQTNQGLAASLNGLKPLFPEVNFLLFDQYALLNQAIAFPGSFGLTNVTHPCLGNNTICSNPDQYLFWDEYHPTRVAHQALATAALNTLQTTVPEPVSTVGVLAVGVVGALLQRHRKSTAKKQPKAATLV